MQSQPLLDHTLPPPISPQNGSPIHRYNIFITCYNRPGNQVDQKTLEDLPPHQLYDWLYMWIHCFTGKAIFTLLLLIPFINFLPTFFAIFSFYWYRKCLRIHIENTEKVTDAFANMVFDPELCYTMKKNHHFFTIEFKELEGFSLNYNQQLRKELNLRQERGKAEFMVYNTDFWLYYHDFPKHSTGHWVVMVTSILCSLAVNIGFFLLIL